VIGDLATDEALLALKIAFLVLLYLFVWLVVRSATRDLRAAPQESIILSPADAAELRAAVPPPSPHTLLVLESPVLRPGSEIAVAAATRLGRGVENGIRLDGDDFVSNRHATIEPRQDGLWVADTGSTNGTFVNGARVTEWRLLQDGDVVRIGQTDLRVGA
jgi:pSer/pThr/pTyr-binding forkhead associated (FHA) protein